MKLFSLMVLLCASLGGYAQDIKGRVVEQENGKKVGLPGANVYWAGTTDGVVTDAEGHFKIKWNKSGRLVAENLSLQHFSFYPHAKEQFGQLHHSTSKDFVFFRRLRALSVRSVEVAKLNFDYRASRDFCSCRGILIYNGRCRAVCRAVECYVQVK